MKPKLIHIEPVKRKKNLMLLLILLFTIVISPSCASSNQARLDAQRKGLMLQDKSEYSRNKRHFKGNAAYKKQMKRQKRYKKNRMRRR